MERALAECIAGLTILGRSGRADPRVSGLAYDSRQVQSGYIFFAYSGEHTDGHRYIAQAVQAGAAAVIHAAHTGPMDPSVAWLQVEDPHAAMSKIAAAFYGQPSQALMSIGVTGTEGKSTTVSLIWQLLQLAGAKVGYFSTVTSSISGPEIPNPEHQTTPEATSVHSMLSRMRDAGRDFAVIEASSHGLSIKLARLADVGFDIAVMTNVTHEHLEFHGTWERYRDDKANLFRALVPGGRLVPGHPEIRRPVLGIVNANDPSAQWFREQTGAPTVAFAVGDARRHTGADYEVHILATDPRGSDLLIHGPTASGGAQVTARINLPGSFNAANSLAALIAAAAALQKEWTTLVPFLGALRPVRGRMTPVDAGQDFELIVDYAHTPSSFEAILPPLRDRIQGKIIVVFGSGGERDRLKRPAQGRIASQYCDIVILADEDPRGEDPQTLLREIAAGCDGKTEGRDLFVIPDRPRAIRQACTLARAGDLVLLLGKGHENSIIGAGGAIPYDEITEAHKALADLGFATTHEV